jgi:hypothetical protein
MCRRNGYNPAMPPTVFETKGVPATRRERIEAAVAAGGRHPFKGGVRTPEL